jgi:hypothetical protein
MFAKNKQVGSTSDTKRITCKCTIYYSKFPFYFVSEIHVESKPNNCTVSCHRTSVSFFAIVSAPAKIVASFFRKEQVLCWGPLGNMICNNSFRSVKLPEMGTSDRCSDILIVSDQEKNIGLLDQYKYWSFTIGLAILDFFLIFR